MTQPDIVVVGGGLLGRLLAWRASIGGLRVALYEAGSRAGEGSAAWVAAGMITPSAEAVEADPEIAVMGRRSLSLWPQWLAELPEPVFYRDDGTLLLWHREDAGEAHRFEGLLARRDTQTRPVHIDATRLSELEPALDSRFQQSWYLPGEAQIDNRALLKTLAVALEENGVQCHWQTFMAVDALPVAGIVVDCRGMGARRDLSQLRGVRGEIVRLDAPDVELRHMLRLLHPWFSVYVVPRAEGKLVVGATSVESDDRSPMSVRGALELLTSAYSLLPALAEARILEFASQVRPALPDNLPAFFYDLGRRVLRINGLYRHGFLLAPSIVEEALPLLSGRGDESYNGRWSCLRMRACEIEEEQACASS